LASERRDVEVAPEGAKSFVAAVIDKVSTEEVPSIADEGVCAVPSTPKSASKLSVRVYHGICCQPIRCFTRSMSPWGARVLRVTDLADGGVIAGEAGWGVK
jgi:hypothetical protein